MLFPVSFSFFFLTLYSSPEGSHCLASQTISCWSVEWLVRTPRMGAPGLGCRQLEVCVNCYWIKGSTSVNINIEDPSSFFNVRRHRRPYRPISWSCSCAKGCLGLLNELSTLVWLVSIRVGTSHRSSDSKSKALFMISTWLTTFEFSYFDIHHHRYVKKVRITFPLTLKWFLF